MKVKDMKQKTYTRYIFDYIKNDGCGIVGNGLFVIERDTDAGERRAFKKALKECPDGCRPIFVQHNVV